MSDNYTNKMQNKLSLLTVLIIVFLSSGAQKPNIIFILTDDQGWADITCHGNPDIETPTLDRLAEKSVEFTNFYVSPLCSPTRASLMSGQYSYRTDVVSTGQGLSSINPEINTWAERLKKEGYTNGLFGKWHLGDTYPHRAQDQGFDEVLTHISGNLQAYPPFNPYLNPVLIHNGVEERHSGYCMDIFTNKAIEFIQKNKQKSFFVYLPTNTPHRPLEITDEYLEKYKAKGLKDQTARVYAMIENIDDNVSRLEKALEKEGLTYNTIFIYMSDNGPTSLEDDRFLANYRGKKTFVYEGGIKGLCFIKYPSKFKGERKLENVCAHIDVLPTILDLCEVSYNKDDFDGISLSPLLLNTSNSLPERYLFWQSHNGMPQQGRAFAVRKDDYKLVQQNKINGSFDAAKNSEFELFNIKNDPYEINNLIDEMPEVVDDLKNTYKEWFKNVSSGMDDLPYPILLNPEIQNPLVLTRRDWLGTRGIHDDEVGYWNIKVPKTYNYTLEVGIRRLLTENAKIKIECGDQIWQVNLRKNQRVNNISKITIPQGVHKITGKVYIENELYGGVHYFKLTKLND
jgi:arylsulfatase A-like enzyme